MFRITEKMKTDFRVILAKNNIDAQHVLLSFVEQLVVFDRTPKFIPDMKIIIARAQLLQKGE